MTLEFISDNASEIDLQKAEILKYLIKSMANDEFLSDEMPQILKLRFLGPDVVNTISEGNSVKNLDDGFNTYDFAYIALGSTLFVAVFAYFTRRRFLPSPHQQENTTEDDSNL